MKIERHHAFMLAVVAVTLAAASYVTQAPMRIIGQFLLSLLLGAPLLYVLHRRDQRKMQALKERIEAAMHQARALQEQVQTAQEAQKELERLQNLVARATSSQAKSQPASTPAAPAGQS